ncbi:MAG: aminoacyl-histidine dipeptidase, partial [Lachnospiraceae bacterium]|nr:aminoacyl-histidine dipeptidase [Lachnospiraceae bacterium]
MRVLENLKPERVFYFFEEICRIPHGSGNTGRISDYLAEFAAQRGLEHYHFLIYTSPSPRDIS